MQTLSTTHELTAMRAGGFSLKKILFPVLLAAGVLSVLNFVMISEVATRSHLATRKMEHDLGNINPLHLLRHKQLSKIKNISTHAFSSTNSQNSVQDIAVGFWDHRHKRINILFAKKLYMDGELLKGNHMTTIGTLDSKDTDFFDNLVVENAESMETKMDDFSQFFRKRVWRLQHADYLKMTLLRAHMREAKKTLASPQTTKEEAYQAKKQLTRSRAEILRRMSIGLAAFSFTLLGISFGMRIGRNKSSKGLIILISLATMFLISYFVGKGFDNRIDISALLYIGPHFIIICASIYALSRISRGIE